MCIVLLENAIYILNRLQYGVNITSICTGKPKNACDSLYCGGLELNLQYLWGMPVLQK